MQNELFDSFDRLLCDLGLPAQIRSLEVDPNGCAIWEMLCESGFLDVMSPETAGGAGLGWRDSWSMLFVAGRHGLPWPIAQTVYARALLGHLSQPCPQSPIALAGWLEQSAQGQLITRNVQAGLLASHVLAQQDGSLYLLQSKDAQTEPVGGVGSFDAHMIWSADVVSQCQMSSIDTGEIAHALALGLSVTLAGAADRVLAMTLNYANDRVQFGKPIGKFQSIQQQITLLAEQVYGMRMASQLGCQTDSWAPVGQLAALAKAQNSQVASSVASIAHAVHAAIGVTHEYDLQLYTRRIYEWARAGAGSDYWAAKLGQAALASTNLLDFVREDLFQAC